ncbi:protein phosphatase 2C domain-containing protein [Glycomyces tritici]|uniref:Protein phosphatase 2C domain-containing protein n=1 Tax=Glycomyces tritici TaxID=2665176 RepID=A0ABT7YLC4_9ACTN|nr:protein phosphatase 2C domain-containing protein [Glycomyces tritici]MDN3239440.1 protein phosphatase 2C domain-containing protein [Glycomyces tritici]
MTFEAKHGTAIGSGAENQDLALTGADWALVLDGANPPAGVDVGCGHGVAWIVDRLGAHLRDGLDQGAGTLAAILREAVSATVADHGPECDTAHPRSPGATVALARLVRDDLEWLVLGDAAVLFEDTTGRVAVETDTRVDELPEPPDTPDGLEAYIARYRNRPGGAWFAGAVPEAADHAFTGRLPIAELRRILLCTNGITRLTNRYDYRDADLMTLATTNRGPEALIDAVRGAELTDPDPERWEGKRHDDATAVVVDLH